MGRYVLSEHWEVICDFMEKHPGLATGEIHSLTNRVQYKQLWEELINRLNSINDYNQPMKKWQKVMNCIYFLFK